MKCHLKLGLIDSDVSCVTETVASEQSAWNH